MAEFNEYKPGTFCWVDLGTTDAEAAKKFYSELFGWSIVEMPSPTGSYTMFQVRGKNVAALYPLGQEQLDQGVPSHWMSYVSVEDTDEIAEKAASAGGTVLAGPFDIMEHGRMVLLQDPTGAHVSAWQPKQHIGAQLANEPGAFSWNELATKDTGKAAAFYSQLFGWTTNSQEMPSGITYTTFLNGEQYNAGMMQITEDWGDVPPNWMVYFAVESCDSVTEASQSLGGNTIMPPTDIPDMGRFSVLQDPQGAAFAIMEFAQAG